MSRLEPGQVLIPDEAHAHHQRCPGQRCPHGRQPGSDVLTAGSNTATLSTLMGTVTINKFGNVTADKQNGTDDTIHAGAIDFTLQTVGNWTSD